MKYIIFSLILLHSIASHASVYIVTDKDTKEVISVSNENDCVLQPNMELTIDKSINLEDVTLVNEPKMYTYDKGKFKANMGKLQEKEAKELAKFNKDKEAEKIAKRMTKLAMDSLIEDGESFKYEHGGA